MATESTSIAAPKRNVKLDESCRATDVDVMESPRKRRKLSDDGPVDVTLNPDSFVEIPDQEPQDGGSVDERSKALVATTPKNLAEKNVAPFLAKHIRDQHAPMNNLEPANRNTRYCYRHRPDMKCRRRADDITMGQMQQVSRF